MSEANPNFESLLPLIDSVVKPLASQFAFGYYTEEDLLQEGRIMCIEAYPKYEEGRGSLFTFFYTHVKNRFISLKRDKFCRPMPKNLREDLRESWELRNQKKMELAGANCLDASQVFDSDSPIHDDEIFRILDRELPSSYRDLYRRYMDGEKLSKGKREELMEIIKGVLFENEVLGSFRERE